MPLYLLHTSYNIMYRRRTANASESYCVYFHRGLAESRPCSRYSLRYNVVGGYCDHYPYIILVYFLLLRAETAIKVYQIYLCCIARGESTVVFDFSDYSTKKVYRYLPIFNIHCADHVYIGYYYYSFLILFSFYKAVYLILPINIIICRVYPFVDPTKFIIVKIRARVSSSKIVSPLYSRSSPSSHKLNYRQNNVTEKQ